MLTQTDINGREWRYDCDDECYCRGLVAIGRSTDDVNKWMDLNSSDLYPDEFDTLCDAMEVLGNRRDHEQRTADPAPLEESIRTFNIREAKTIGDIIIGIVPEQFLHFFYFFDLDGDPLPNRWLDWNLDGIDEEDTISANVWNLMSNVEETLAWMPDASPEFTESTWQEIGKQCQLWALSADLDPNTNHPV